MVFITENPMNIDYFRLPPFQDTSKDAIGEFVLHASKVCLFLILRCGVTPFFWQKHLSSPLRSTRAQLGGCMVGGKIIHPFPASTGSFRGND